MIKLCVPDIRETDISAVTAAIKSGWLTQGPYNKEFEGLFADYIGVKHAITCNSCTSALFLVLKALGITGEVIIPSFSFVATANAVVTAGAIPRFADIEYKTCNLDPEMVRAAITPRTEAIMVVHFGGQCCRMDSIMEIASRHDLQLIEDSAETIGGTFKGRPAGSFGSGCFSFFPTKNITTGEGGLITTNDDRLAGEVRTLIGHGISASTYQREKAEMPWFRSASLPGYNFRMSNILAALGFEQMKRIGEMIKARQEHSAHLIKGLKDLPQVDLPHPAPDREHVYQMFTIKLAPELDRDLFVKSLVADGIGASVHFFPPIHKQGFYQRHPEWEAQPLKVTEDVSQRIVTLPMFPGLNRAELDRIIEGVRKSVAEQR